MSFGFAQIRVLECTTGQPQLVKVFLLAIINLHTHTFNNVLMFEWFAMDFPWFSVFKGSLIFTSFLWLLERYWVHCNNAQTENVKTEKGQHYAISTRPDWATWGIYIWEIVVQVASECVKALLLQLLLSPKCKTKGEIWCTVLNCQEWFVSSIYTS